MSTAPFQGGLRPALAAAHPGPVNPGLVPHAILASAPRTAWGRSFAMAACVYLLLGGSAVLAARMAPKVLAHVDGTDHGTVVFEEPHARPVDTHLAQEPQGGKLTLKGEGGVLAMARDLPVPLPSHALDPEGPVEPLPSADHSKDGLSANAVGTPGRPGDLTGSDRGNTTEPNQHGTGENLRDGAPVEFDYSAIRILSQVAPVYPPVAKLAKKQGPVELLMTIDERGVPVEVQVVSGEPVFRAEAVRAAREWRFAPAKVGGQAVSARFHLNLNFVLR